MIVYIESNFVLEPALLREEHRSCDPIYDASSTGPMTVTGLNASTSYGTILQAQNEHSQPFALGDLIIDRAEHAECIGSDRGLSSRIRCVGQD